MWKAGIIGVPCCGMLLSLRGGPLWMQKPDCWTSVTVTQDILRKLAHHLCHYWGVGIAVISTERSKPG